MSKRGKLLSAFVILVMVLAIAGVASAKTYDGFTYSLHEVYQWGGYDKPPPSLEVGTQITDAEELGKFNASDDQRDDHHQPAGSYDFHRFKFKIDEPVSQISQIFVLHEGYGDKTEGPGHTLYIWNYENAGWESVESTDEGGPPDQILTGTFTSGFSNYLDEDGYLHLLAITNYSEVSCPYLYVWNGSDYIFDNDIIPFEKSDVLESTDYYRVQEPLEPDGDFYKVRIAEELPETAYLDLLKLMTIDHPADVDVYPDIDGNLFTIKNPMPPVSCVDNYGNDCLELIAGKEGYAGEKYYTGSNGEYLVVDFGDLSQASIIKLVMTTDYSILVQTAIQTQNEAGEWETRIWFSPHEFWATNVFDITDLLPDGDGEYKLRFYFTDTHSIDYIAIDTSEEVATTVNILDAVYADLDGDVLPLVADSDDNYVVMTQGDELFLKFPYQPMSYGSDFNRDFVFISEGYYQTEEHNTIYTDYVKVEITTPIDSDWEFTAPTIDGNFDPGEWTYPQLLIEEPIHAYVYSTNDDEYLYVCVDAANAVVLDGGDYTPDDWDQCSLHFDTGHDEQWTPGHEDAFKLYGNGSTAHWVAISPTYELHCNDWAGNHPGLQGVAGFAGSPNAEDPHRIYEFKIPLSLLGASPGDTIGFASPTGWGGMTAAVNSLPHDAATGRHNIWPPGADVNDLTTWGDLVLAPPPPPAGVGGETYPVNKLAILVPWLVLAVTVIFSGVILVRRQVRS